MYYCNYYNYVLACSTILLLRLHYIYNIWYCHDKIPSISDMSEIMSFKASGTGLGLKNFGQASLFT